MGKAYTDETRTKIRKQLLEAGLQLFHESGVRNISIRELTKRAGIAQGGFYSFFPDKDTLVIELIHYRAKQKMELLENTFEQSLKEPAAYVSDAIFRITWDLNRKARQKQMYADILHLCINEKFSEREKLYAALSAALQNLSNYWEDHNLSVRIDIQGVMNVIRGVLILNANLEQLDDRYAESILKTFIEENCKKYILCDKGSEEVSAND